jgi:hypothetical protein
VFPKQENKNLAVSHATHYAHRRKKQTSKAQGKLTSQQSSARCEFILDLLTVAEPSRKCKAM